MQLQRVHPVLGGDVAAGDGRERAAAEPAERRLEGAHARLERGVAVGEAEAVGVVQVAHALDARVERAHGLEEPTDLRRVRVAGRVGEADRCAAPRRESAGRGRARAPRESRPRSRSRTPTAPTPARLAPASTARRAMATMRSAASAVPMPVFFRLCVSLADTPMQKYLHAARQAALEPLLVQDEARQHDALRRASRLGAAWRTAGRCRPSAAPSSGARTSRPGSCPRPTPRGRRARRASARSGPRSPRSAGRRGGRPRG